MPPIFLFVLIHVFLQKIGLYYKKRKEQSKTYGGQKIQQRVFSPLCVFVCVCVAVLFCFVFSCFSYCVCLFVLFSSQPPLCANLKTVGKDKKKKSAIPAENKKKKVEQL